MIDDKFFDKAVKNSKIEVKIIADSMTRVGKRITSLQLKIPTIILAELNTHRVFSRSASSARAIPFKTMVKQLVLEPFIPEIWTRNKPGMQGNLITNKHEIASLCAEWKKNSIVAIKSASELVEKFNVHKQIANRLLTPFMWTNVVVTATEFENFFALRNHEAAEPHFHILARKMQDVMDSSEPVNINNEKYQWHLPYISEKEKQELELLVLQKISVARCARVSYRPFSGKDSIEKDVELYEMLLKMCHMSPFEHIAQTSDDCKLKSRNLVGLKQYREIVEAK